MGRTIKLMCIHIEHKRLPILSHTNGDVRGRGQGRDVYLVYYYREPLKIYENNLEPLRTIENHIKAY